MIPIKRILLAAAAALFSLPLAAQVPFPGSYSQDFDSMGTAGTVPPTGWSHLSFNMTTSNSTWTNATGIPANGTNSVASIAVTAASTTLVTTTTPTGNQNNGYNAAASAGATSDRVIATAPSSVTGSGIQAAFTNATGTALTSLTIAFDTVRFNAPTANQLPGYWVFISTNGTAWTNVTPNPTITTVPSTAGVTATTLTASGLSIDPSGVFYLRWLDDNAQESSPDQIIGLNNVSISVATPNSPPTVALTAPTTGATYDAPAAITLTADAADTDGTISKVEFFQGATKLGEDTTAPYEYAWSNALTGSYALTAKATDNLGGTATSTAVNITVTNADNAAPSVTLTAPANGATILTSSIALAATAADTDGVVAKVEFFNGTTKLGEDTTSPYTYNWTGVATGTYMLSAVATDNDGATTTSAASNISVAVPITTTLVAKGATWKYLDNGSDQGTAWKEVGFNDSAWASGPAVLGGGDSHIVTNVNIGPSGARYITTYFRRTFNVAGAAAIQALNMNILRDDGVVVWINGTEVARQNMPAGAITYLTDTPDIVSNADETTYFPATASPLPTLNEGQNTIAVEVHQRDGASSDLGFDMELISLVLPGTPPTVAVTAPADSATFTAPATIAITADAADADGTVTKVEFFEGTNKLGEATVAPYTFDWTTVPAGSYVLTAKATDNFAQSTTSAAVNITVAPPNTLPPTVAITAPANNANVIAPATIAITANAADSDGSVSKVEFFNGATKLGEDTSEPYSFDWSNVAVGDYTLTAVATDNQTATTVSSAVVVHVLPNQPPMIAQTAPADLASVATPAANLEVSLSDPESQSLAVTFYGREKTATAGADFTLVTLPDTQNYSSSDTLINLFKAQTQWIVAQRGALNIAFVSHMGDMTNNSTAAEYVRSNTAMSIIEDPVTTGLPSGIPWGGAPGNHDPSGWDTTYGPSRFAGRPYFQGNYPTGSAVNSYQFFSAGGMDFLHINLAMYPTTAALAWADGILKANPNRRAILTSHSILNVGGSQTSWTTEGTTIYGALKGNPNLFLMLCGHMHGIGRRTDVYNGNTIYSVLQDYQDEANGGDSWLRYFTFSPANNKIMAYVIRCNDGTRRTDAESQFEMTYNMQGSAPWTALGTVNVAAAGTSASIPWTGLTANTQYEWYATVTDGVTPVSSGTRSFTAEVPSPLPTVAITAPANGASFIAPATITLTATAADSDGTVSKVEFFDGADKLGEDTSVPYSFEWTNVPVGDHTLTAVATDNLGVTAVSSAVVIHVVANQAPTVAITAPADGASFIAPAAITISATAADSDSSVSKVEFFDGTTKLGEDTTAPYTYDWSNITVGGHVLTAVATDNLGLATTSSPVNITVNLPTVTITATLTSAVEYGSNRTLEFTITRSGPTTNALVVPLVAGGSATEGTDYSGFVSSVTIPAGDTTVALTLTVLTDSAVEGTETVTIALGTSADFTAGTPASADATIADGPGQPRYVAGDWHQHTTYTDGRYSFGYQMARNNQFGLDWWANSEHGGAFNRCGRLSGTGADPLNATVTWASMGITGLGNNLAAGNMWRWQSIRDYSFADVLTARTDYPSKVIIQGYEWNVPGLKPTGAGGSGHEHCSMGSIAGEFDASPNANVVAQFEYQFDMSDGDTSSDNGMGWSKSGNPNTTDAKMVEGAAWLQANHPTTSWLTPAHPERKKNWTGATFRKLNDAAPSVAFGFESMPGHQRSANRGEYGNGQNGSNNSNGGGTYGGGGYFSAKLGGLWDSLLGEGRHFWLFTSSDSHEVAANDFYPGEYQKTYSYASDPSSPQAIVDGLRSGNSFVVQGDLIDSLDFKVDGAVMGSTLLASGHTVTVSITVHDPEGTNNGPAGFNSPTLDHIDLIAGEFGGLIPASDPAYSSESNPSTAVIARFDATGGVTDANGITSIAWNNLGGGTKQMSIPVNTLGKKLYFRLRGSNVGLNVSGETDGAGNPLVDAQGQNTVQKAYSDLWFYSNPVFVESRYFAGDFHQHTTYSDGSNPFATVMAKNNEFGLDWWANSEHGGKFTRNAAGPILTSGFDTAGYAQFWDALGTTILGDSPGSSGGHANMWRWQSLRDFSFNDVLTARGLYPDKTIVQGVEWNVPGHEHCSVGMITDEFGPNAHADAVSMFEYLWDANDADTSRGAKTTTNNHAKAVAAVQWMQANYPTTSWMVPAHPERRGVQTYPSTYTGSGSQGYSVAAFRDLNNAGPDVCFGFESMPGHQKDAGRGGYGTGASGGGTFGGCGTYAARVGGLWDAMLGEGRHFWLFVSSDFHNTGGDFWPGEYQKTYTAATNNDAQSIVNGLRSGNSFVVEGDLIDALDFTVGSTDMGGTLASASNMVTVSIRVHDPVGTNHGPAGLNTPTLDHLDVIAGQYGSPIAPTDPAYTNDMNLTTRVIARFAATSGPADSTGLVSQAWTDLGDGWKQMTLSFDTQWQKTYFRLRGSNLGLNVVGQTDGAGNPLVDPQGNTANDAWADLWFYSNPVFVAPVISYTVWAAANASGQDVDQDTNHTGVPNGIRYFMGATGSSLVANPGIVNGAITWPKSPAFMGTYRVEVSSDLATWEPATTNYASYITDNGTSVVFTLPPVPGKLFTRLRVTPY
jgi:hypothetical protein